MNNANRGMPLENKIEHTNKIYDKKGLALVHKEATPWTVLRNRRTGQIYKAFPREKATVDFEGVSHGRSIAFDAKSTRERTRFPLNNIEQHQIDYLLKHQDQGGLSFFIVEFSKRNECYFATIDQVYEWWKNQKNGGRKSIPYQWFYLNCEPIRSANGVALHYLEHCKTAYKRKDD